ncbi:hypothetical protein RQ479_31580 [Mesorhizobium sp. ISC25]|uniref:hypothetical protein n=1 Tax=Mesorhizobium sp. ISC25 TaxID=3077335 RepID=UPI0035DD1038
MTMPSMRRSSTGSISRASRAVFLVGIEQQNIIALGALVGRVLHSAYELGEKGGGDVRNRRGDGAGLGGAQAARCAIRPISQRAELS